MSIWTYQDAADDVASIKEASRSCSCIYCSCPLRLLDSTSTEDHFEIQPGERTPLVQYSRNRHVFACDVCGWWRVSEDEMRLYIGGGTTATLAATAKLRDLDITDLHAPMYEVRAYLAARFDARFQIHPRRFEEVVASVFRDIGYQARVTGYSGDDGVDVILDGPDGDLVGVQVKRHRNSIEVDQIRSLAGALVLGGMTRGVFVTTSTFQTGAAGTADRLAQRGYPIELLDAPRFYQALQIAQRNTYRYRDEPGAPFTGARLVLVDSAQGNF